MNNPSAFPTIDRCEGVPSSYGAERGIDTVVTYTSQPGMTLRDYFAAKALQGMCANGEFSYEPDDKLAQYAYARADAMLKARES